MLGAVAGNIIGSPYEKLDAERLSFTLDRNVTGLFDGRSVRAFPKAGWETILTLAVASWVTRGHDISTFRRTLESFADAYSPSLFPKELRQWLKNPYGYRSDSTSHAITASIISPVPMYIDDLSEVLKIAGACSQAISR